MYTVGFIALEFIINLIINLEALVKIIKSSEYVVIWKLRGFWHFLFNEKSYKQIWFFRVLFDRCYATSFWSTHQSVVKHGLIWLKCYKQKIVLLNSNWIYFKWCIFCLIREKIFYWFVCKQSFVELLTDFKSIHRDEIFHKIFNGPEYPKNIWYKLLKSLRPVQNAASDNFDGVFLNRH